MESRICPVCHRSYTEPPALSRVDNKTEICPDCGMMEALAAMPRPSAPAMTEVQRFIRRFTAHGHQVEDCFTCGCCFWFARVLTERFPGAEIVYDAIANHFAARIGGRVYDITGDVTDKALAPWQPWDGYEEGSSHRAGIIRDCILF